MKRTITNPLGAGEDSFLDIIANLVGVLIILVAVVGTQAKSVILTSHARAHPAIDIDHLREQQRHAEREAIAVEVEIERLQEAIKAERARATALAARRHDLLVALEIARRELESALAAADDEQRQRVRWQAELAELDASLDSYTRQVSLTETESVPQREIIQHYPTPLAKTVFSDEVHFRLERGRIVYVPLDELVQRMRGEWKVKAEKLLKTARTSEIVGPVDDFRLHYELVAETVGRAHPSLPATQALVRLDYFQIIPTRAGLGETVAEALQANSHFQRHLSRYNPAKTTVSIWVYPDSFGDYNRLRRWLRERGYQTASWPLSPDRHIAGSPDGLRTSAQ